MTDQPTELPSDLKTALGEAQKQYRAAEVRSIKDVFHEDALLSFIPNPSADESWPGGQIIFRDKHNDEFNHAAEIVDFNPDDGNIFVDIEGWSGAAHLHEFHIQYKPFDYSGVLIGAFEKLRTHPKLLNEGLAYARGYFEDPPLGLGEAGLAKGEKEGIDKVWPLRWGYLWGPPGTGKTQTVAEALERYAAQEASGKILVVTPTNNAADEIAHRLCSRLHEQKQLSPNGYCSVYRGGRGAGKRLAKDFPECLRDKSYAELYDATMRKIEELDQRREMVRRTTRFADAARIQKEINALRGTLPDELLFAITKGRARVIILTTYKASVLIGEGDNPVLFDKIIFDEAGMVSRIGCAALSTLGRSCILSGDPKQIGPIFKSPPGLSKDVRQWLLSSGLSHLTSAKHSSKDPRVCFLKMQHRMHPDISYAVGSFTYDGILVDGEKAAALKKESKIHRDFPNSRAAYLLIDGVAKKPEDAHARKPSSGVGYERLLSAKVAVGLAASAAEAGQGVLLVTPYRAQVRLIRKLLKDLPNHKRIHVGTIHRQQGAEQDVVIIDLVRGALSWQDSDINTMINVAMSRAKRHFVLVAAKSELATPALKRLIPLLAQEQVQVEINDDDGRQTLLFQAPRTPKPARGSKSPEISSDPPNVATSLGEEIIQLKVREPLLSHDQVRLLERNIGEGHLLVRGVAGSGKSLILANWAIRLIQKNPEHRVLVTYFNTGMANLLDAMLNETCKRSWMNPELLQRAIHRTHIAKVNGNEPFDAVFVDEAQDMDANQLMRLYNLCSVRKGEDGKDLRSLILFYDDSQNIYGREPLEELKDQLPTDLSFSGRSVVLKEAYRSTRSILSFSVNLALDPKKLHSPGEHGLLQFMKVDELQREGLLTRPEDTPEGLYKIHYTGRAGVPPTIIQAATPTDVFEAIAKEVRRLIKEEGVPAGAIMVVTIKQPQRAATMLNSYGIKATAYGGKDTGGTLPLKMPARGIDHVRCTTVFSCKGHESPVVFFANIQETDTLAEFMKDLNKSQLSKVKRCALYVGSSRAMVRQYICGIDGELMRAAQQYSTDIERMPGLL